MKSLKNSKVLVTGANGFIGSHLTEKLVNLEAKVSIIVRPNSNLENLKNITNKINVFKGHLNNYEEVKKIVDEVSPEFIFHLAANVNASRDLNEIDKSIENKFFHNKFQFYKQRGEIPSVCLWIFKNKFCVHAHSSVYNAEQIKGI